MLNFLGFIVFSWFNLNNPLTTKTQSYKLLKYRGLILMAVN